MRLQDVDKNFKQQAVEINGENKVYNIPCAPFELYGVEYEEGNGFYRMPSKKAKEIDENILWLASFTSGGRIRFSTDADVMIIHATWKNLQLENHMSLSGTTGFLLMEDTDSKIPFFMSRRPEPTDKNGFTGTFKLPGDKLRYYTLWLPLYNDVESLKIELPKDAKVEKGKPYKNCAPILYYGNSITQGGCAGRPDNCFEGYICKYTNVDFINLGFSGNGLAQDGIIEHLATIDCSIFVCDYDHNAPTVEHLKNTHEKLFLAFRKTHPTTPVIFMTAPNGELLQTTGKPRREVIRTTYKNALKRGDNNVYFLDGRRLYGKNDRYNCTVEGLHPNDLGFYRMAQVLYKYIKPLIKD